MTHRACIVHLFIIKIFAFSKKSYNSFSHMVLCWKLNTAVAAILEFQSLLTNFYFVRYKSNDHSYTVWIQSFLLFLRKNYCSYPSCPLLRTKSCIDGHLGFLISLKNLSFFKVPSIDNTCTTVVVHMYNIPVLNRGCHFTL